MRSRSEHLAALTFYAALSIAISWPLAAHFSSVLTGGGLDALSHLWGVWHSVQAFAGLDPFFYTTLLYYPAGASLLLHSAGPFPALLALPFWAFGPVAAYNGGLLLGLTLTGYAMYLLARDIGCSRAAAIFAGIVLLAAPVHLVGLRGHLAKVFLGLMPLALLAIRRALDARQPAWWAALVALLALLALLHSPFQLVQVAIVSPVFVVAALREARDRRAVIGRTLIIAAATAAACGPLLIATARAASDPAMAVDRSTESAEHQPDLTQFLLPPSFSALFGETTTRALATWNVSPEIETEVSVPIAALLLIAAAMATRAPSVGVWIGVTLVAVILSFGPTLHAFGRAWPVAGLETLPYSWVTALPGLDFLRTPPRFMQIGFVAIAAASALGLTRLAGAPRAGALAAIAALLVLVEVWPVAWPGQSLPPTPVFYQQIAADRDSYGVLDLPVRPLPDISSQDYSARYQAYQLIHGKGIAGGYLSRVYARHPVSPCVFADDRAPRDVRVNGRPSRCELAAIHQLSMAGYRFVVWHQPGPGTPENLPGSWAADDAQAFVSAAFGETPPMTEDDLVRVWAIPPAREALPAEPVIELGKEWYPPEPAWRWSSSPATLTITTPRAQEVELAMSVPLLHDRSTGRGLGEESVLIFTAGGQSVSRSVRAGDVVRVALSLVPGAQNVSVALGAGNFRPSDYGEPDSRLLSFAIAWIELTTKD